MARKIFLVWSVDFGSIGRFELCLTVGLISDFVLEREDVQGCVGLHIFQFSSRLYGCVGFRR